MEKVLIIDDERFTQQAINKFLVDHYKTRTADDGRTGIKVAHDWSPDIILLDVEMPGQNGYEVCDELKRDPATSDIPVVFLSANDSLREKMLGFEVGADDYLLKSAGKDLLIAKIDKIGKIYSQRNEFKATASNAEKTAMEAMSTSFELGKAVRFVERTFAISSEEQLGSALCEVLNDLQLNCCVMLSYFNEAHFYTTSGSKATPIEIELMAKLHDQKRIVDFSCRTQINYPRAAVLIKNMPLDDRARYGRIKDTIPFVLSSADAKLKVLEAEGSLTKQTKTLTDSIGNLESALVNISRTLEGNQKAVSEIMLELNAELNLYINKIALEDDQEHFILDKVDTAAKKLVMVEDDSSVIKGTLSSTAALLRQLCDEQERIIRESLSSSGDEEDDNITNDIELF